MAHLALFILRLHDAVEGYVISSQVGAHQVSDAVLRTACITRPVAQKHCTAIAPEQAVGDQHAAVLACSRDTQTHTLQHECTYIESQLSCTACVVATPGGAQPYGSRLDKHRYCCRPNCSVQHPTFLQHCEIAPHTRASHCTVHHQQHTGPHILPCLHSSPSCGPPTLPRAPV
jgi:hypothetical protein